MVDTLTRTLTKADVINMLRGTIPVCEELEKALTLGIGEYHGGQSEHFEWCPTWREEWELLTIQELYDLYCDIEVDNHREDIDKLYSVYVVSFDTGYDDGGIEGIFTTEEKALQYMETHRSLPLKVACYSLNEKLY